MTSKRKILVSACLACLACWAMPMLNGCGGGADFGEKMAPQKSARLAAANAWALQGVLRLPGSRPFNVADTQRKSDGPGVAESTADSTGKGSCLADASAGGKAEAEFQIGHVFAYQGSSAMRAKVTFNVQYQCELDNYTPRFGAIPLGLKVYVMDSNRRLLAKQMLAEADPDRTPTGWDGEQTQTFDVTFEPQTAYHLVVAGRVEADGSEGAGPRIALTVSDLDIAVSPVAK